MSKSVLVIINPNAGQEKATDYKSELQETLAQKYSKVEIRETEAEGDATNWAREAGNEGYDLVVAIGGDGTVNETVNGLTSLEKSPVLGIVPMGTVNDLAQALQIPLDPIEAIELLIEGQPTEIDVGRANEHYFSNFVIIGQASQAIHEVDGDDKTKLGPLAYFIETGKKLTEDDLFAVEIEFADESWKGEIALLVVALIDSIGGMNSILKGAEIGDGQFFLLAIEQFNISQLLNMTPKMLMGKIEDSDNVHTFHSDQVTVRTSNSKKIPSDMDGEEGPNLPITFKILPQKLQVISGFNK